MGEFAAKNSTIRVFHANQHIRQQVCFFFFFFLSVLFSLRTDEMCFFALFLQIVDPVGYRLEDQKSGTVELAFLRS